MASGTTQPGFQDAFKQYQDECQNECDIIKFMIMWYLNFCQIKLSSDEVFRIGSTIHSDEWRAYMSLRNDANYTHSTVNHSINFVDPTTGVHTQNIENTWMRVKRKQKKQGGICRTLLPTYLEEFMWRQEFGDKPLKNLILQINSKYPVQ